MENRFDSIGIDSFAVELMKEPLPVENNSFDLVLFNEVMEHFPLHPLSFSASFFRNLAKGSLVFSVPNFATSEKIFQMLSGRNPQDMMDKSISIMHIIVNYNGGMLLNYSTLRWNNKMQEMDGSG